ncbi:MAG: hypothetical protein R3E50_00030 [Halioglobus sp.]
MAAVGPEDAVTGSPDAREAYFGTTVHPRSFPAWLAELSVVLAQGQRRWLTRH